MLTGVLFRLPGYLISHFKLNVESITVPLKINDTQGMVVYRLVEFAAQIERISNSSTRVLVSGVQCRLRGQCIPLQYYWSSLSKSSFGIQPGS